MIQKKPKSAKIEKLELDEKKFRWMLNDNAMAYEKTGEGIRKFAADVVKLEKFVAIKALVTLLYLFLLIPNVAEKRLRLGGRGRVDVQCCS